MTDAKLQRISIKRSEDSVDGRVISYLQSDPFNQDESLTELVISTLKAHWLPLAMFNEGVRGEKMRQIGIVAISKLEAQINIIRRICGIDIDSVYVTPIANHQISTATPIDKASIWGEISENHSNNNSQSNAQADETEEEDDDDDWGLMKMENTEEMEQINKIFGV
ncbi:hypothetical protein [Nodularia chucula]|uniref:hypothetical protein n=1 Tax=Nodularia chucula TaxID=3093667 RepID=UPI0039C66488